MHVPPVPRGTLSRLAAGTAFFVTALAVTNAQGDTSPQAEYRRAEALMRQGHWGEAAEVLHELAEAIPDNSRLANALGVALSSAGERAQAEAAFRRALDIDPSYGSALKNLALSLLAGDSPASAAPYLERLSATQGGAQLANAGLAQIALRESRFGDAARHFALAGDVVIRDPALLVKYARALAGSGHPDKALSALKRLPAAASPDLHYEAGLQLATLEAFGAAAVAFQRSRGAEAGPYQVGFNRVLALARDGQHGEAARVAEHLIAEGHREAELMNLVSRSYEAVGATEQAYNALRDAIELRPSDGSNYVDLVALCLEHENFDLGLEIADIAVDRLVGSPRLHIQRGVALAMKGRFADAERSFARAAELDPERSLPGVALGLILMQQDRVPDAVRVLREQSKVAGDDHLVHWFLAEALQRSGIDPGSPEGAEAVGALRRSIALEPRMFQSHLLMGKILADQGRFDEAIRHLEQAREIDPSDVSATYQLALAHRRRGNAVRARELLALVSQQKEQDRQEFAKRGLLRIVREGSP